MKYNFREHVYRAVEKTLPVPVDLVDQLSFVDDLGFDSLRVASLSIALEIEFGRPILLNDWLGTVGNPADLTIGSLTAFLTELLREET